MKEDGEMRQLRKHLQSLVLDELVDLGKGRNGSWTGHLVRPVADIGILDLEETIQLTVGGDAESGVGAVG